MSKIKFVELGTLISPAKVRRCGDCNYAILSMTMHDGLVFQNQKFKKEIASKDKSTYKVVYRNQLVISFPIDEGVLATQRIVDAGIVSPAYGIWDIDMTQVVPEFLEYALRCDRALSYYKSKLRGSTARRRSLPTPKLLAFTIPLPSLEEQKHIMDAIEKSESLIAHSELCLRKLDELVKSRFVEMFGDNEYATKSLYSLIEEGAGLSYGIIVPGENIVDGVPMIRPSDFKNGKLSLENVYRVNSSIEAKYKRTRLIGNEILVQVIGQPGQVMLCDERCKGMNVTRNLAVVRLDESRTDRRYIAHYLSTQKAQDFMLGSTKQSTLKQLPLGNLKELPVPMAPMDRQEQFATFVEQVDKSKFVITQSLEQLEILKKSLMQKYFG